jgi:hypothetical protein
MTMVADALFSAMSFFGAATATHHFITVGMDDDGYN